MKLRLVFLEMQKHLLYDYMSPSYRTRKKFEVQSYPKALIQFSTKGEMKARE